MDSLVIYFFVFFLEFIFCYFASKTKYKFLIFISFLIPIIFIGFRYNVGTDYKNYLYLFYKIKTVQFNNLLNIDCELGALILFKLISICFSEEKIIFVALAFLSIYPLFKSNKMFDYKFLPFSILIFNFIYLPFFMNGMRQGVAISFILYSFILLLKKKNKRCIFNFFIAFLFHTSSIFVLPYFLIFYFINKYKKNNILVVNVLFSIFVSFIILFYFKDLMNSLNFELYSYYINDINSSSLSFQYLISYIPSVFIILFMKKKNIILDTFKSFLISGCIYGFVGTSSHYLSRIGLYFTFFEVILMPYLLNNINDKKFKLFLSLLYFVYLIIYFLYQFYFQGKNEIIPYQNWLF